WKGAFYPGKLPPAKWLAFYSSVFNTVELNSPFYRIPKPADIKRQYDSTPEKFKFSVKMNRYITHTLKLKKSQSAILEFQDLFQASLKEKLHKFLFQMPPSFRYSEENLELICENIPRGKQNVIELRDSSWWNKDVEMAFKKMEYTFCNIDHPKLKTYFEKTSNDFYFRLHGSPELFKSSYSDNELEKFYNCFPIADSYTVYFNNTFYDAAYKNALFLKGKLKSTLEKLIPQ
ncbi:MAG TPA: DUF72 domain-containing protein, partial [Chitinophagales bacterium]|nr:DUF72 domain-containing protein [Chitinophagales bacterium]